MLFCNGAVSKMCLIVDNNVVARVLCDPSDRDFDLLHASLFSRSRRGPTLVHGGQLTREFVKNGNVRRALAVLDSAGRARTEDDREIKRKEAALASTGLCKSNDLHVLALALASAARLLCTLDGRLRSDFKDSRIVKKPRGKLYKRPHHEALVRACCS